MIRLQKQLQEVLNEQGDTPENLGGTGGPWLDPLPDSFARIVMCIDEAALLDVGNQKRRA